MIYGKGLNVDTRIVKDFLVGSKDRKMLNLQRPLFCTWPEDCFLTSMILNQNTAYDWIMNSFVQICAYKVTKEKNNMRINFLPSGKHHFRVNLYDYCPFISKYAIDNEIVKKVFGV